MSKRCCYKNCHSKLGGSYTLFTFPKEVNRFCEWIKRSECNRNEITTQSCICEKHFLSKYISSNPRRKILLGNALPVKYWEQNVLSDINSIDGGDEIKINREFYEIDPISEDDEEHQIVIPDDMICEDQIGIDYNIGYQDVVTDNDQSNDSIIIPTGMDIEDSPTPTTNKLKSISNALNNLNEYETGINYDIPCLRQSTTSTHNDTFKNINSKKTAQNNLSAITTKTNNPSAEFLSIPTTNKLKSISNALNNLNEYETGINYDIPCLQQSTTSHNDTFKNINTKKTAQNNLPAITTKTINPSAEMLSPGNKINSITTTITTATATIAKTTRTTSINSTLTTTKDENKKEYSEKDEITTFIFKGEEYVQMPKRIYMEEKDRMSTDLNKYKNIIINFKKLLDGISFD